MARSSDSFLRDDPDECTPGPSLGRKVGRKPVPEAFLDVPQAGPPSRRTSRTGCPNRADYSDAEREFMVAMERFKRSNRCPFPSWREVLSVLTDTLGYRQPQPGRPAA